VALAGLGSFYLWKAGLAVIVWWPLAATWVLGYVLAWYWQRKNQLLRPVDFTPPLYWTERDKQALDLVRARAEQGVRLKPEQLGELQLYVDTARELALDLARFYHPEAKDPLGALTIPEILAVVELAAHDLARMADDYLPGGHLLTIKDWRLARQVVDWYPTANTLYWIVSAVFNPIETAQRFLLTRPVTSSLYQKVEQDLSALFFAAYVKQVGTYLIELNSGRLRIGASRYRELKTTWAPDRTAPTQGTLAPATGLPPEADGADRIRQIGLTVIGQVKAGKSSLINALLGEQRAITDVLPATDQVTRYELHPQGIPTRLVIFDAVGYGHEGAREDQLRATEEAARHSDLLLLVLHARNPARQADLEMLRKLRAWFASRPETKMPPVLGVLTHIDLLSPAMEWAPPYDWVDPQRPKERQIQEAWNAVKNQLRDYLVGIVPVCTAGDKVYGMDEWFWPTLTELLDEAHAVALLRCIRAEANTGKVRKVFQQFLQAGQQAAKVLLERYGK
jgi:predicted GTPase